MTSGEAKMLETEVVIFPMTTNQEISEISDSEIVINGNLIEKQLVKIDLQNRFARLKKSLRKRSVSIL